VAKIISVYNMSDFDEVAQNIVPDELLGLQIKGIAHCMRNKLGRVLTEEEETKLQEIYEVRFKVTYFYLQLS
jgi:hypothetical protein